MPQMNKTPVEAIFGALSLDCFPETTQNNSAHTTALKAELERVRARLEELSATQRDLETDLFHLLAEETRR